MSVWFITGASRGLGFALTQAALEDGDQVVAAARNPDALVTALASHSASLLALPLDVTDEEQAIRAAEKAVQRFGRIDILVNNAGYGLFGAVEEASSQEVRHVFDTNVFGLLAVTRAVLPTLRAQRSGRILNIGSSAGFAAGPGIGMYAATKFAVEAISEALYAELRPLGVGVTVIELGSLRTSFLTSESQQRTATELIDYAATVAPMHSLMESMSGSQPGDPVRAAQAIRALVASDDLPLRCPLGSDTIAILENRTGALFDLLERSRIPAGFVDFPVVDQYARDGSVEWATP